MVLRVALLSIWISHAEKQTTRWCWQKFGPDGYSLLHRATWRPGEAAVDALVYLLDFLDVDTRAVRTLFVEGCLGPRPNCSVAASLQKTQSTAPAKLLKAPQKSYAA